MGKLREALKTLLFAAATAAVVYFTADILLERVLPGPQAEQKAAAVEESVPETAVSPETDTASGSGEEAVSENASFPETGYAYSVLEEEDRKLYEELYMAVTDFSPSASLSVQDPDRIERIFACMLADHPEIFYVDGYTLTTRSLGAEIQGVSFQAEYTFSQQQVQERQLSVEKAADETLSAVTEDMDDYEKLKLLYESVAEDTEYDLEAPENQTICSVFLYGRSVCQGYAKAFEYLCLRAGIPAVLVTGTVEDGTPHAWTAVRCNGEWYYADPAWGDVVYQTGDAQEAENGEETAARMEQVDYDYFLVTTEQISATHKADDIFPLPECTCMTDNYYVREGLYFTRADIGQAAEALAAAGQEGRRSVTLKCADRDVYEALYESLITRQEIFQYLQADAVSFAASEERLSLTFFLADPEL